MGFMAKPKFNLRDFQRMFPDDDTCLEWLLNSLYPEGVECPVCKKVTRHHKLKGRKAYSCDTCGHQVHPTAGTIFHKSSTPLTLWFYAIYLMSSTRTGIPAKQIERELGVTYKTAWRMFKQIRSMLADGGFAGKLSGTVETDDTLVYQKPRRYFRAPTAKYPKSCIVGAVERDGRIRAKAYGPNKTVFLENFVVENVEPGSTVYTDENAQYRHLANQGYTHGKVTHWNHQYVDGIIHTNTIEGFWGNFKTGLRGAYKHCGVHYLQSYVNEYAFRHNHRNSECSMFYHFMGQIKQLDWWVPYAQRVDR